MVWMTVVAWIYSGLPLTETLERVIRVMADIDFLQFVEQNTRLIVQ
jgi:hypothetical protein